MITVLLIEDDPIVRLLGEDRLSAEGFKVITAEDAHSGIEKFKCLDVDIVVTDLQMKSEKLVGPSHHNEGLEVIKVIKTISPETKVVLFSGSIDERVENTARMFGANAVLNKLFDSDKLVSVIWSLVTIAH